MANYQEQLRIFKEQWNLPNYDLNEYVNSNKGIRYTEAVLTGASIDLSAGGEFVRWLSKTLAEYFEENTSPNEDGKYMSSFEAQAFYDSFKALVQAKFDDDAKEKGNAPLQVKEITKGQKGNVEKAFAKNMSKYQKTLPALWMENLKSKKWDIQGLENVTNNATNLMLGYEGDKAQMEGNLTSVVVAFEAMRLLRESRNTFFGWFWKLFNGARNEQEEAYFLRLSSQLSALDAEGYKIDGVIIGRTDKTILGEAVESIYKVIEKQYEERENQENLENLDLDVDANKVNTQQAQENTLSAQLKGKAGTPEIQQFVKKIAPKLQEPLLAGANMVKIGVQDAIGEIMNEFDELNKKYEEQMQAGNKEKAMEEYAFKVFSIALVSTQQIGYENGKELVITAQKITDAFLKEFSPCRMDESLQEFADNYAIKNSDKIIDSLKGNSKVEPFFNLRLDDGFKFAREELFPEKREQVFDGGEMFAENEVDKSLPVVAQSKPSAPTMNNANK